MFFWRRHRRLPAGLPGLLVAVLALASQLALGAIVLPDEAVAGERSVAALDALSILCTAATPAAPDGPRLPHRHNPDRAICPLSVASAMPVAMLGSGPAIPAPPSRLAGRASLPPPARGPPAQPRLTPPSQGPPS